MGEAHIMVPGNPFEIYDFANGSGSYIHLTLFAQKKKKTAQTAQSSWHPL